MHRTAVRFLLALLVWAALAAQGLAMDYCPSNPPVPGTNSVGAYGQDYPM